MRYFFLVLIPLLINSCKQNNMDVSPNIENSEHQGWQHKDLSMDSLPGISLDKAYAELVDDTKGEEIIVALIDSPIDIYHEDLKNQIYLNPDEIPNNNKDDDHNGYVDDIHGWNFLGYGDDNMIQFANYDYIRVIRRLSPIFKDRDSISITEDEISEYQKYQRALKLMEGDVEDVNGELAYHIEERKKFKECIELFSKAYSTETGLFDFNVADTLTPKTERQKELLADFQDYAYYGWYPELMDSYVNQGEQRKAKVSNLEYNERKMIGDNIYNLDDIRGNGNVNATEGWIAHATQVAGAIAATRGNNSGVKGISNKIKLMVLSIFPERGDELDKDVANAIRYAVDNGARVINYSHGRYFVDREDFIMDALKYAEQKGVLVVTAAGNSTLSIDTVENSPFPKDNPDNKEEVIGNLIKVGASGKNIKRLKPMWSSYGKDNVDFFAPGQRIKTTNSGSKKYFELGGSSLSCAITSGVAALLFSQYPDLSAEQVKTILIMSGTPFDQEIEIDDDLYANFKELSKSGKVLNAYNALLLAKEVSESKQ